MADQNNMLIVAAEFGGHVAHKLNSAGNILNDIRKAVHAFAAPSAAIVEEQHIETVTPQSLGEIEVFFIAGKSVQQNYRRMWARAIGQVQNTVQPISVTLEIKFHDGGRASGVYGLRVF